ncbi:unnamed protein product [Acanthosepion pharaonis]|uniref:Uncharacterized protein n=1 Tax=Acanthosepion pharaonis TaxID=158019 RepID=A0A812BH72_ACAPH|nr:unnamed protein product [Sepia pharaonis]
MAALSTSYFSLSLRHFFFLLPVIAILSLISIDIMSIPVSYSSFVIPVHRLYDLTFHTVIHFFYFFLHSTTYLLFSFSISSILSLSSFSIFFSCLFLLPLFLFSFCLGAWPTIKLKLLSFFLSSRCSSILVRGGLFLLSFFSLSSLIFSSFLSFSHKYLPLRSFLAFFFSFSICDWSRDLGDKQIETVFYLSFVPIKRVHLFHSKMNPLSRIFANTSVRPLGLDKTLVFFANTSVRTLGLDKTLVFFTNTSVRP